MDKKQIIISIGREYGSGGHFIATKLAEIFDWPLYDSNLLSDIAAEKNLYLHKLSKYDEVPKKHLMSRTVCGYNNSPEENVANLQFNYLRKRAEEGKSFIVVGRCAEEVLKGYEGLITFFVLADMPDKIEVVKKLDHVSTSEAKTLIKQMDKNRKLYHNYYCSGKWGDSRNYDLCINSSKLGFDGTTEFLAEYIRKRMGTE